MNKTSMNRLKKELAIRIEALPTLKAKETALRVEVKKVKEILEKIQFEKEQLIESQKMNYEIWMEYPSVLSIQEIIIDTKNIAGVKIPILNKIVFNIRDYSLFSNRAWVPGATEFLKKLTETSILFQLTVKEMEILQYARKKTTQKVNLYEKVQIPEFNDAIGKITRFLEDEENLSRSAQKIIKARQERESQEPQEAA
jgi:V/A-type H+-transporting ATPase subunit D